MSQASPPTTPERHQVKLTSRMRAIQAIEARNKAAIERYSPVEIGRKPKPGEEVLFVRLRDDLMLRVWGDDLESTHCYSFDFINNEHDYILKPNDVNIYTLDFGATFDSIPILPIGWLSVITDAPSQDSNQEDYIVKEGATLRITQQNQSDIFVNIPMRVRTPIGATLVLQPLLPRS